MKIRFSCPSCSKTYSVDAGLAGKKAKCKQCGTQIIVPQPQADDDFVPVIEDSVPVQSPAPPPSGFGQAAVPVQPAPVQSNPFPVQKLQPIVPASAGPAGHPIPVSPGFGNGSLHPERPSSFLGGDTMASNPGSLKISKLRYAQAYPFWCIFWHSLALISVLLVAFHSWWWIPLLLFAFACVWFYWHRIKMQFLHGCANPAKVVSLDPPLIAAYTNLTKGNYDLDVVKICEQPLGKMSTGNPTVGQPIATVAFYEDRFEEGPHWSTFDPKPAACVSSDQQKLAAMLQSFEAEDWQQLDNGLAQIPQPLKAGHYRIYKPEEFQRVGMANPADIYARVMLYQQQTKAAKLFSELNEEEQQGVQAYTNNMQAQEIWCVLVSSQFSQMYKQGMALTAHGVFFNFKDAGKGAIRWTEIVGSMCCNDGLEIMMRNKQRLLIPDSHFIGAMLDQLDVTLDVIAGRVV